MKKSHQNAEYWLFSFEFVSAYKREQLFFCRSLSAVNDSYWKLTLSTLQKKNNSEIKQKPVNCEWFRMTPFGIYFDFFEYPHKMYDWQLQYKFNFTFVKPKKKTKIASNDKNFVLSRLIKYFWTFSSIPHFLENSVRRQEKKRTGINRVQHIKVTV